MLIAAVGALAFYTAFRVVDSPSKTGMYSSSAGVFSNVFPVTVLGVFDRKDSVEFSDVCRYYFGKWGEYIAALFSLATLLGATIVYWVLMSNFLYFTGAVVHGESRDVVKALC